MKSGNDTFENWSRAHVPFGQANRAEATVAPRHDGIYHTFFQDALRDSPNGPLYHRSAFLQGLATSTKTYLGHVTHRLTEIVDSGAIYASGGCLVGSVYCFPMTRLDGSTFRAHNLGEYIYHQEAAARSHRTPDMLLFEVENTTAPQRLLGIDYLRLGEIHFGLFSELEHLLSPHERSALRRTIESRIRRALPFLTLCQEAWSGQSPVAPDEFFEALRRAIPHLPVLGYVLFESIAEYLMLYADSAEARSCAERGEFYNVAYKELVYALRPDYRRNFHLTDFTVPLKDICRWITQHGPIMDFDPEGFALYLTRKIIHCVNTSLFTEGCGHVAMDRVQNFEHTCEAFRPLVGHLIHRELRSFGRYPDFYFYYDQLKAVQAWNYWNRMGISVPFNGVFPKGEAGINPANPELNVRIFRCEVQMSNSGLRAIPVEAINARLVPRLVDLKYTLLRDKPPISPSPTYAHDHRELAPLGLLANLPALAV